MDRILEFTLSSEDWGDVKVMRPIPVEDDPWGDLAPLKGTPLGDLIPRVSGESFSHATHGFVTPLMREIGPDPSALVRLLPKPKNCASINKCIMADKEKCVPGPSMPDCYIIPGDYDSVTAFAALMVLRAWKEGRYVVIVDGPEFG